VPELTPAQAAHIATMAMRRRPPATVHDVRLTPEQRALAVFKQGQPALAGRFADSALLSAGHTRGTRGCRWHLARALASRWRLPAPRYHRDHLALLGKPCSPACRAALLPRPKPKPVKRAPAGKPRALRAGRKPGTLPVAPLPAGALAHYASVVASAAMGRLSADRAQYNRAALARMGVDPRRFPHLVTPR
jgi:hypothetical protein